MSLGGQAASETSESAIARNHAMTRDHDRQRGLAPLAEPTARDALGFRRGGLAPHRKSFRRRESPAIAARHCVGMPCPRARAEDRTRCAFPAKYHGADATASPTGPRCDILPSRARLRGMAVLRKRNAVHGCSVARDQQSADGSIEVSVVHVAYFTRPACRDTACPST